MLNDYVCVVIGLICGIITAVLIFVELYVKQRTRGNKLKEQAERDGTVVTAVDAGNSTFVRDGGNGKQQFTVRYRYVVNGVEYKKKIIYEAYGTIEVNHEIIVYYDKNNPKKSVANVELYGNRMKGCSTAFVAAIVVTAVVSFILRLL